MPWPPLSYSAAGIVPGIETAAPLKGLPAYACAEGCAEWAPRMRAAERPTLKDTRLHKRLDIEPPGTSSRRCADAQVFFGALSANDESSAFPVGTLLRGRTMPEPDDGLAKRVPR